MDENESNNSNEDPVASIALTSAEVSKKRKPMRARSIVWNHFKKYIGDDGSSRAKCNYCSTTYAADTSGNGTSSLNHHMKRCLGNPHKVDTKQAKLGFRTISKDNKCGLFAWQFDQEVGRKSLVKMIIADELPLSFVEREGFKNFISDIQPQFRIPSRVTITRDCFQLFLEEKKKLKHFLAETHQRVSITIDMWISVQRIDYMCLTAHFIDKDWKLQKNILNFYPICSHKGDDMAMVISKCLLDWGLDKVFTVTIDNASLNDTTCKELSKQLSKWGTNLMDGRHLHVRCMGHMINLIVQEGLKEVGDSLKRIRQVLRYIKQSPQRVKKFKDCCEKEKISSKKSLCLDVPTRWNSTLLMLNSALEFENALASYCFHDPGLNDYLLIPTSEDGEIVGTLTVDDWKRIRNMSKFLEIFYNFTVKVSGSLYVTSNVHFQEIGELSYILKLLVDSDDIDLSAMASNMKAKFDKYLGNPEKMNMMIFIACVLDPRYKLDYVAFVLQKMYGEEEGFRMRDEINHSMKLLFREYQKIPTNSLESVSSTARDNITESLSNTCYAGIQQEYVKHILANSGNRDSKTELDKYLSEETEVISEKFDILLWWKVNSLKFPTLAEFARNVLAIPISTVASESAFSSGERVLDAFRSSLTPQLVQAFICVQNWIRSDTSPIKIEEDLEYLEKLESELIIDGSDSS